MYHDVDDEAVATLGAIRLLQGELPYRDFTACRATLGIHFLAAPVLALLGPGPMGTRILMGSFHASTGVLVYLILHRLGQKRAALVGCALWNLFALHDYRILNYHWSAITFTVLSLYLAICWILEGKARWAWATGVAATAALWQLQSNGITVLAIVGFLWLRFRPPHLARFLLSFLLAQLVIWLPWVAFWPEIIQSHFSSIARHVQFNTHPFSLQPVLETARSLSSLPLGQDPGFWLAAWSYWIDMAVYMTTFYPLLLGLPLLAEWRKDRNLQMVAYAGLAWALTSGYCQTYNYLTYVAAAYILAACLLISRLPRAGLWLAIIALWEILGWSIRSWHLQVAYRYPVATRVGTYFASDSGEALVMNRLHQWVNTHCPPDTPVLAYPYFARIYVHEKLRCPLPDPTLLPWLWDEHSLQRALKALKSESIPFIFYRVLTPEAILADYPAVPAEEFRAEMERWNALIFRDYQFEVDFGGIQVWRRKP